MTNLLLVSIAGGVGSTAFGLLYHLKPKHLFIAFIGGFLTTFVMFSLESVGNLVSNMAAAFVGAMFCMLMSRYRKAPFTVFMIPCLFPLVPGRALYYSMVAFVEHNKELFITNFVAAIEIALGIAVGIMLASIFDSLLVKSTRYRKK